jgi:hypothetical protein
MRSAVWGLVATLAACGESRGTLVTTASGAAWRPTANVSWQIQLTGTLDTTVDVALYEVDLFDTPASTLADLHAAGKRVICYVSVGTDEDWRADATGFPPAAVGNALAGFPRESWLDTRDATVRALMAARLGVAANKGCDGVDLANLAPGVDTGFPLTTANAVAYARLLAGDAHARGLGAGLSGATSIAPDVQPAFDWTLAEECVAGGGCAAYAPFISAGKVALGVEFGDATSAPTICPAARAAGLDALIKNRTFDAFRIACP